MDLAARLDVPGTEAAAGQLAARIAADGDQVDPLTSREREIAALSHQSSVQTDRSQSRLVLSERTVESHVSQHPQPRHSAPERTGASSPGENVNG